MTFVLLILALVCFLVAAISGYAGGPIVRINFVALGLAFWVATLLIPS